LVEVLVSAGRNHRQITLGPPINLLTRSRSLIAQLAASLAIVAITTLVFVRFIHVNSTTIALVYLLGILAIATGWGLAQSVTASLVAMLCFNYFFLPPVGQFIIADPQNWVALVAFLTTALAGSSLSDRAKKQAQEARAHQRETEQLYALSRSILLTDFSHAIGFQAVQHIAEIFECRAVALYDAVTGDVFYGGAEDLREIEGALKQVAVRGASPANGQPGILFAAITLGGRPIGSLALKGLSLSDGALQALLNLVAISLERVRMEEAANRAEAARQSEEFKSTLLDAIAHEFKTPLTSIKAGATSMLSDPARLSPQFREFATIIDEEVDRLSRLVTEAVRMSQIDAGKVRLEREPLDLAGVVRSVLDHCELQADGRKLNLEAGEGLPPVWADRDLIFLALRQLIDNGLKYSPPGSPLDVTVGTEKDRVVVRVADHGQGIPERERERIFDKFYRRQASKKFIPGTGLGLYIAREIIRAHGGDVWVEGEPGSGAEFCVALPVREGLADAVAEPGVSSEHRAASSGAAPLPSAAALPEIRGS
jgi:two-component system sensor histidine kinase KdpD